MHSKSQAIRKAPVDEEQEGFADALEALLDVAGRIRERAHQMEDALSALPPENQPSALNLVRYVALREHDLRDVQELLAAQGLSSLGRAEARVLANLDAVIRILSRLVHGEAPDPAPDTLTHEQVRELLSSRTEALFGEAPADRHVRIMVTMPSEAATDFALVRDLLASGMNCMRINCAHDGPAEWQQMVNHLRRAERELDASCAVLMDIPGPRLRTGPIEPGPQMLKIKPQRDELGWVVKPADVWLTPTEAPEEPPVPADARLPVSQAFLADVRVGDHIHFRDTRGSRRSLRVVGSEGSSHWARLEKTAYVATGTRLVRGHARSGESETSVGALPAREQAIVLHQGDTLILTADQEPGQPAQRDPDGRVRRPARIPCVPPDVLMRVKVDDRIWFDDGKIGGVIRAIGDDDVRVEITSARPRGDKLRSEKGINMPDTELGLPGLTEQDAGNLQFIVNHADLVGYSFVRSAANVAELQARLEEVGGADLGVVLKIETLQAFENLPRILVAGLRSPAVGVMIARGDLAVECGFARLAEVQEEILWLCEAAHLPVIWATQVLERLAKDGRPSRAEVTDAAMAERAECVMLNKGPYVVDAVRALDSILQRMEGHQEKKRPLLRPLSFAERFFADDDGQSPAPGAAP